MAHFKKSLNFFIFSLFVFIYLCTSPAKSDSSTLTTSQYLKVPINEFESTVQSAMNSVRSVTSEVSKVANTTYGPRLSDAISDCIDLLNSSLDLLLWCVRVLHQGPTDDICRTGDVGSDLKTWLSGVHANLATCMEGLANANHSATDSVGATMDQAATLTDDLLSKVQHVPTTKSAFTSWLQPRLSNILQPNGLIPNVTVAADGSGDFTSINQSLKTVPKNHSNQSYVIYIKKGIYNENINIKKNLWNIIMVGDGMNQTIISGDHSNKTGSSTFRSATFGVSGCRFIAINITFENRAGEEGGQAVALRSNADQSIFYRCEMRGYQDTLYAHRQRQFYRECRITGTVDFIFGDAIVVFQRCDILARQRQNGTTNTITAQSRRSREESTGFSFHLCNITGDWDLMSSAPANRTKTYLGRPWKRYARVVIMESSISDVVEALGWQGWPGWDPTVEGSVYLAEYNNNGLGSNATERVKWPGVHASIDRDTATQFTVSQFIQGTYFIPSSTIPYLAQLQS